MSGSGARATTAVHVRVPRALAADLGGVRETTLLLSGDVVVRDVLDALAASRPALGRRLRDEQGRLRRFVNVYVDGDDVRRAQEQQTPVPAGSTVDVVQSVAGG